MHPINKALSALAFSLFASLSSSAYAQLQVFACEPEWAALSQELGGDNIRLYTAVKPGQDPHHIQARPSLIAQLRHAELTVCSGAELEQGWLPMLQRRARNPQVMPSARGNFEAARQIRLLEIPQRLDRSQGDVHAEGNPHFQTDPRRLYRVAQQLSKKMQDLDPENQAAYQQRLQDFNQRWKQALSQWRKQAAPLRGKRAIVYHQQWIYLFDWLGIQRLGALEPKPSVPPTASHLSKLAKLPKADWIILSPLNNPKPAEWLHNKSGAPIVVLPQTVGATDDSNDLFSWYDSLLQRLLKAQS